MVNILVIKCNQEILLKLDGYNSLSVKYVWMEKFQLLMQKIELRLIRIEKLCKLPNKTKKTDKTKEFNKIMVKNHNAKFVSNKLKINKISYLIHVCVQVLVGQYTYNV